MPHFGLEYLTYLHMCGIKKCDNVTHEYRHDKYLILYEREMNNETIC